MHIINYPCRKCIRNNTKTCNGCEYEKKDYQTSWSEKRKDTIYKDIIDDKFEQAKG